MPVDRYTCPNCRRVLYEPPCSCLAPPKDGAEAKLGGVDLKVADVARAPRPEMSQLPRHGLIYQTRATCFGDDKYARSNFYAAPPPGIHPAYALLAYLDAGLRHLTAITDAVNAVIGTKGAAATFEELASAFSVADDQESGGFPASGLPHFAHLLAGLGIAVQRGVLDGLLPADPGTPWRAKMTPEQLARRRLALPQKDRPAAERERLAPGGKWADDCMHVESYHDASGCRARLADGRKCPCRAPGPAPKTEVGK